MSADWWEFLPPAEARLEIGRVGNLILYGLTDITCPVCGTRVPAGGPPARRTAPELHPELHLPVTLPSYTVTPHSNRVTVAPLPGV